MIACWGAIAGPTKPRLALCFEYARLPQIPRESWDVPLDGICTESGLFFKQLLIPQLLIPQLLIPQPNATH